MRLKVGQGRTVLFSEECDIESGVLSSLTRFPETLKRITGSALTASGQVQHFVPLPRSGCVYDKVYPPEVVRNLRCLPMMGHEIHYVV